MNSTSGLSILVTLALLVIIYFIVTNNEGFSSSGLAVSDKYCDQLANIYYRPDDKNSDCRGDYRERICGNKRRNTIDYDVSNYYTVGGQLV